MNRKYAGKPRGLLKPGTAENKFRHDRILPAGDLEFFVEHFWIVRWDYRGQDPYRQEILSHPSIHLVFENGSSRLVGVVTGKFSRILNDKSRVFGIKFRPGAFYPFIAKPVSEYTDHIVPAESVFGSGITAIEEAIAAAEHNDEMIDCAERFLVERLPEKDNTVETVNRIISAVKSDRSITKVDEIVRRFDPGKRTLQRIFNTWVGVSPKWVIKRYRLHEVIEKMETGTQINWADLARELGYYDQSHFVKDFRSMVGLSPTEYFKGD